MPERQAMVMRENVGGSLFRSHTGKPVRVGSFTMIQPSLCIFCGRDFSQIEPFLKAMNCKYLFDADRVLVYDDPWEAANLDALRPYHISHIYQGPLDPHLQIKPGMVAVMCDAHAPMYDVPGAFVMPVTPREMAYVLTAGELWIRLPQTIGVELPEPLPKQIGPWDAAEAIASHLTENQSVEIFGDGADALNADQRRELAYRLSEYKIHSCFFTDGHSRGRMTAVDAIEPVLYKNGVRTEFEKEMNTPIDRVQIGSIGLADEEDFRTAAEAFAGRSVHPQVKCFITPVSRAVYRQALQNGDVQKLVKAGVLILPPTERKLPTGTETVLSTSWSETGYTASVYTAVESAAAGVLKEAEHD
jgi:hypothetical protein